jgi:hypothetical protein
MTISRSILVALAGLAAILSAPGTASAVPASMPVQGLLTDTTGVPLEGAQQLRLRLYTVESGGTAVHDESQVVTADRGAFTMHLGATASLDLDIFDGAPMWLGVTVGTDAEMSPRLAIGTVPYAAHAARADDAARAAFADECGSVPTGAIMFFDVACPAGWAEYTALNGRVPVGGSPGTNVGAALTNAGTRTITQTPNHTHPVPALTGTTSSTGSHTHTGTTGSTNVVIDLSSGGYGTSWAQGAAFNSGQNNTNQAGPMGSHSHSVSLSGGTHNHGITTSASTTGSASGGVTAVDVTMPYRQLRACRKI